MVLNSFEYSSGYNHNKLITYILSRTNKYKYLVAIARCSKVPPTNDPYQQSLALIELFTEMLLLRIAI